jgi:hypothetical protein
MRGVYNFRGAIASQIGELGGTNGETLRNEQLINYARIVGKSIKLATRVKDDISACRTIINRPIFIYLFDGEKFLCIHVE